MKLKLFLSAWMICAASMLFAQDEDSTEAPETTKVKLEKSTLMTTIEETFSAKFKQGTEVETDRYGFVISGTLAENTLLKPVGYSVPVLFKENSFVTFNKKGEVDGGILADNHTFKSATYGSGLIFKANTELRFFENGNVRFGTLLNNVNLIVVGSRQSLMFQGGKQVYFNKEMAVLQGYCGKEVKLTAKNLQGDLRAFTYPEGAPLKFDAQGNVTVPPPKKKKAE